MTKSELDLFAKILEVLLEEQSFENECFFVVPSRLIWKYWNDFFGKEIAAE